MTVAEKWEPRAGERTLEDLWREYGSRIEELSRRALGDHADAVDAVSLEVMTRAAYEFSDGPAGDALDAWPTLEAVTLAVCRDAREGKDPPVPTAPMPEAIPYDLRAHFHLRALRTEQEFRLCRELGISPVGNRYERLAAIWEARRGGRRLGMLPLAAVMDRWRTRLAGRVRDIGERVEGSLGTGVHGTASQLGALLTVGSSTLSQAVAAVAAVVALGIGPPPGPARTHEVALGQRPLAQATASSIRLDTSRSAVQPSTSTSTAPSVPGSRPQPVPPEPGPSATPDVAVPQAPDAPVGPVVTTGAPAAAQEPVRRESRDGWTSTETAQAPTSADVDGDDDEDFVVPPPVVFTECPSPEERGAVTGLVCPVVEEQP